MDVTAAMLCSVFECFGEVLDELPCVYGRGIAFLFIYFFLGSRDLNTMTIGSILGS